MTPSPIDARQVIGGVGELRSRGSGSAAMVEACLDRIARVDKLVQAWEFVDADEARRQAAVADASTAHGALHGVPIGVKDIIDVANMPTRCGSSITDHEPRKRSADCIARLQAAGAIVLGKTVTTEFAYYQPGKTRNPWNSSHTPGGSSSGSAAAVASGMVPVALGTQTNGSIVRPAAFCGVAGFKPTCGAVSNDGVLDPWPTLDHTGVFARSVEDAALVASIIGPGIGGMRECAQPPVILAVRSPVWDRASPEQQRMYHDGIATLQAAGATVRERSLDEGFVAAHEVARAIMAFEAARFFAVLQASHRDRLSTRLNGLIDEGKAITPQHYDEALRKRDDLISRFADFFGDADAVLTPPARGEAPATLEETGDPVFCTLWSLIGAPAINLPSGYGPAGLPLGLQFVGARGRDAELLGVASWCESRLPWPGRRERVPYGS